MTDENRTVTPDGAHSSGIKLPGGASDSAPRKINPVQAEHTGKNGDEIKLPEAQSDIISDAGAPRFIKTGTVPKIALHEQKTEETDVAKFTDRLSVRPQQRTRTGYTGKINTYAEAHSAGDTMGRMITPEPGQNGDMDFTEAVSDKNDGFVFTSIDEEKTETVHIPKQKKEPDAAPAPEQDDDVTVSEPPENNREKADTAEEADSSRTKKIPEKGGLLRKIAGSAREDVPLDPDQLMMDGYGVGEDGEDGAREEALREARAKKVGSFHFWNKSHEAGETSDETFSSSETRTLPSPLERLSGRFAHLDSSFTPVKGEEYTEGENRKAVFARLIKTRNACMVRAIAVGFVGIVLLLLDMIVSASASSAGGFFTVLGGSSLAYNIVNSVFLVVAAAVMFPDLKNGLFSLLKIRPKADTALLFMYIFAAVQNAALYSTSVRPEYDMHLFTPAAILLSVPYLVAKLFFYDSTRQCFKAVSSKSDKSYLRKVSDINLVRELLRASDADESVNVVYAGKTKFIRSFLTRSADSAAAAMPASRLVLLSAAASILFGVWAWVASKSFAAASTAAALTALCSFPVSSLIFLGKALADENKKLSLKSSFIQGYSDARDFSCVDDLVIDDTDVIKAEVTKCISAKNVKEKQAMFVAGSLTSVSGGLLKSAFAKSVAGFEDRMPAVDGLVYEDKLGVSAWVSGCKILLGTHALLVNHNVGVPDESVVNALIEDGCLPVYLAIEGRFAALYSVKYSPLSGVADNLRELAESGSNVLISSVDPNITDSYAESLLGLPADSVRMLSKKVSDKMTSARTPVTDSEEAGVVFGDSVESLCRSAVAALRLDSEKRISKLICTGACIFGMVITAFLVFTGAYAKTPAIIPLVLQLIWTAFCFLTPGRFAKLAKPRIRKKLAKEPEQQPSPAAAPVGNARTSAAPDTSDADNGADSGKAQPGESAANTAADSAANTASGASNASPAASDSPAAAENGTDDSGDPISAETYSALDEFAKDEENATRRTVRTGRRAAKSDYTEPDGTDCDDTDGGDDENESRHASFGKGLFGKMRGFFEKAAVRPEDGDDEDNDDDESDDGEPDTDSDEDYRRAPRGKHAKARPAKSASASDDEQGQNDAAQSDDYDEGILIPGRRPRKKKQDDYYTSEKITDEYRRKKAEDDRVRSIFTVPDFDKAPPHYDTDDTEPVEEAKFVPPTNTGNIDVFDDSLFSPFEDDKIFAGLHDTPPQKIDFN